MNESEVRACVAEVVMLRSSVEFAHEEEALLRTGAARGLQIRSGQVRMRIAELRAIAPNELLVAADMEIGSPFAADGIALPPQMALGAAGCEELASAWGRAVGWEGRRLGIDVAFGPVLDVNTNPANPIVNIRSFGEDPDAACRLGAALVRGFMAAGLGSCGKHWPGSGDLAVDCHLALGHLLASRERLRALEWRPFAAAIAAGLNGVMSTHVMVPEIDAHACTTVSAQLIAPLRAELGLRGLIYSDSLGMEGLRQTMDSAEAAWRSLAAGHDQVLIDYRRPPSDTIEAIVAAASDGRLPLARLRSAAEATRHYKAAFTARPPLPENVAIRQEIIRVGRQVAALSLTGWNGTAIRPDLGPSPLVILCDDLVRVGAGVADELGNDNVSRHPVASQILKRLSATALVLAENPTPEAITEALLAADGASAVLGVCCARISCYKGDGVRLPGAQRELWNKLRCRGRLPAMILLGSPYALADLPQGCPTIVGYGDDGFTVEAAMQALDTGSTCPGRLPVTVEPR